MSLGLFCAGGSLLQPQIFIFFEHMMLSVYFRGTAVSPSVSVGRIFVCLLLCTGQMFSPFLVLALFYGFDSIMINLYLEDM